MCEILPHLNDLEVDSFEVIFDHFLTYIDTFNMAITLKIDGDSRPIIVFEEVRSNHIFGPKRTPTSDLFLDVMTSLQLLEDPQNLNYDNFVY